MTGLKIDLNENLCLKVYKADYNNYHLSIQTDDNRPCFNLSINLKRQEIYNLRNFINKLLED